MNLEYYINLKNKIREIIKNNNKKINELNNNIKKINITSFGEKMNATIISSAIIILSLTLILSFNIDIVLIFPMLTKLIPFSPIIFMPPIFLINHLTSSIFDNIKSDLISNKLSYKLGQKYSLEIETAKIKNKNKIYKKTLDFIKDNNSLKSTSTNLKENIENYLNCLFNNLDILSTKLYLNVTINELKKKKFIIISKSFAFGLLNMLLSSIPIVILNVSAITNLFSPIGIVISGLIGSIIHFSGSIIENNIMIKSLKNINNNLGENKLLYNEDNIDLKNNIDNIINNIYILQIILYEQEKKSLELSEQSQKKNSINNSLDNNQLIDNKNENIEQSGPKLVKIITYNKK